ncbi:MAG: UbiA family prenyltransferase [Archangiaceae bacterium]|nr:UbiA family prenyltransferase [Archangiaceae bacterium]
MKATVHSEAELSPAPREGAWFKVLRVKHWLHFLALPVAGVDPSLDFAASAVALLRGFALAFLLLAFGYLINGISDRFLDRAAEKNPLAAEPHRDVRAHAAVLGLLAACVAALCLNAPWPVAIAAGLCLLSGLLYSVGPRLKRYPLIGTAMNATHFGPLLWVGLAGAAVPRGQWALTAVFGCLILQSQLLHEQEDREEDEGGRVRTSVLAFGQRWAAAAGVALGLAAGALAAALLAQPVAAAALAAIFGSAIPAAVLRGASAARLRALHRRLALVVGAALFLWLKTSGA